MAAYAAWSDAHTVFYSTSSDQGITWSQAVAVNIAPANTAIFPWIAAATARWTWFITAPLV